MRAIVRDLLGRRLSVEAVIEIAMWLAIPYILIGLLWSFFHAEQVQQVQTLLQTRIPAGSEIVAFGQVAVMWPMLLVAPGVCAL
jgi:hypothetical protein